MKLICELTYFWFFCVQKFNLSAKNVGLTYPKMGEMTLEVFSGYMQAALKQDSCMEFTRMVIGRERHEGNGEVHFHCYLYYPNKVKTSNPPPSLSHHHLLQVRARKADAWDFELAGPDLFLHYDLHEGTAEGLKRLRSYAHPNIKRLKKKRAVHEWIEYCKKGGEFISIGLPAVPLNSNNYIRKRADQQAWEQDAKAQTLQSPFPFRLPDGTIVERPKLDDQGYPAVKRRHYCFLAPPSSGKTSYFQREFAGKGVYWRPAGNQYLFEKGSYHQEQVIIYDDVWPKFEELVAVCNVYEGQAQVYGASRYTPNYWKPKQQRVIIMLLNKENCPKYIKDPTDSHHKLFLARFMLKNWPAAAMPPQNDADNVQLDDETMSILNEIQSVANQASVNADEIR